VTPAGGALLDQLVQRRRAAAGDLTSALDAHELKVLRDLLRRLDSAASGV